MIIGCLVLEIYLPYSHSLKEKRQRLKRLHDRLKSRHNVAVSELDFQDKWQRSRIGMVTLNSQKSVIEKTLNQIVRDIEETIDGEVLNVDISYL
ncbi:MAG: DUF503 domain-containing protein [Candidatus Aminicenantaceae bacterium]